MLQSETVTSRSVREMLAVTKYLNCEGLSYRLRSRALTLPHTLKLVVDLERALALAMKTPGQSGTVVGVAMCAAKE